MTLKTKRNNVAKAKNKRETKQHRKEMNDWAKNVHRLINGKQKKVSTWRRLLNGIKFRRSKRTNNRRRR